MFLASLAPLLSAQGFPAMLVETAAVERLEFPDQLTLVGRTEARAESHIVAEIADRVSSVDAGDGQPVRRGAVLVTIDDRRIALALEAKRAEAAQARADADLAAKELERARELVATSVFPERNLDSAQAEALRTAERFRQLDAECRQLLLDLESCRIRAPYAGSTVRKLVDVGEWVAPGTPVFEMVDLSVVKVTVDLPERRFGEVAAGSPATIALAGAGEPTLGGKVTGIAPRGSEATHTFPVTIAVENPGNRLGSGMLVRATLTLQGTTRSLAVSKDAVIQRDDDAVVYTVVEGQAVEVPVILGARLGEMVAVASDRLEVGQEVVVRGNERLAPGSAVRAAPPGGSP